MKSDLLITVLSTADWDSPVWTNKQHIAVRLMERGYRVRYVESLGLRRPTFSRTDAARVWRRLRFRANRTSLRVQSGRVAPEIISPRVIPLHDLPLARLINTRLLARQASPVRGYQNILYTFSPLTYGLHLAYDRTIYHSVDFLHELPRVPRETLLAAERDLLANADLVAASSPSINSHLSQHADDVVYWPNVADVKLFRQGWSKRSPAALFAGHLTPTKINLDWLLALLKKGIRLEVAGPISIDGTRDADIEQLLGHPYCTYHGVLDQSALAQLAGRCTVGLIPYAINGYTVGVFPMKVAEYLAGGLAVVASDLPALLAEQMENLHVARSRAEFLDLVEGSIDLPSLATLTSRFEEARARSWDGRLDEIEAALLVSDVPRTG